MKKDKTKESEKAQVAKEELETQDATASAEEDKPASRLKFVGKKFGLSPLREIAFSGGIIKLPEHGEEPFECKEADLVVRVCGSLYKKVR